MNQLEAIKVKKEIEAIAAKHGLWVETTETRKPDLKDIIVTISIRVTGERNG